MINKSTAESGDESILASAARFVRTHPEFGIIPLLLTSVPILARFVPEESPIGPIIYIGLVLILLPMAHRVARFLTDQMLTGLAKIAATRIFQTGVGFLTVLFVILLLPLLGIIPANNILNRLAASAWEIVATSEVCDGDGCMEPAKITSEKTQSVVTSGSAPKSQNDPLASFFDAANGSPQTSAQPDLGEVSYEECIKNAYEAKDADGIVACADIWKK